MRDWQRKKLLWEQIYAWFAWKFFKSQELSEDLEYISHKEVENERVMVVAKVWHFVEIRIIQFSRMNEIIRFTPRELYHSRNILQVELLK